MTTNLKDQLKNYYLGKRVKITTCENKQYKGRIIEVKDIYLTLYWEREKDWLVNELIFINAIDGIEEL